MQVSKTILSQAKFSTDSDICQLNFSPFLSSLSQNNGLPPHTRCPHTKREDKRPPGAVGRPWCSGLHATVVGRGTRSMADPPRHGNGQNGALAAPGASLTKYDAGVGPASHLTTTPRVNKSVRRQKKVLRCPRIKRQNTWKKNRVVERGVCTEGRWERTPTPLSRQS